ncbi:hypothetical protein [Hyphomonas sp.]|uniref:hypothetical protein n=1 Tax=Hyphomonas sp. TaxID=87 RepID=UPI001BD1395F|nr:hypothetical protein [Hyphomonas sp.]
MADKDSVSWRIGEYKPPPGPVDIVEPDYSLAGCELGQYASIVGWLGPEIEPPDTDAEDLFSWHRL